MLQHSLAVDHCRDCDLICFSDVDNAVAIGNQLTDVFFVEFRNLAAGSGEASQFSRRGHNCSNDGRRISRRIDGDISGNGFDIGEGSWRPDYFVSHWLNRFSTSSCVSVPSLASSRPCRTLSRT